MFTLEKIFGPYPCAHRAWAHDGHCRFVHGHNWTFTATFTGYPDPKSLTGFLLDFGKFDGLKAEMERLFDHTLLIDSGDPLLPEFQALRDKGGCNLIVLNGVSCEALSVFVAGRIQEWLDSWLQSQATPLLPEDQSITYVPPTLVSVRVQETDKNSITHYV